MFDWLPVHSSLRIVIIDKRKCTAPIMWENPEVFWWKGKTGHRTALTDAFNETICNSSCRSLYAHWGYILSDFGTDLLIPTPQESLKYLK